MRYLCICSIVVLIFISCISNTNQSNVSHASSSMNDASVSSSKQVSSDERSSSETLVSSMDSDTSLSSSMDSDTTLSSSISSEQQPTNNPVSSSRLFGTDDVSSSEVVVFTPDLAKARVEDSLALITMFNFPMYDSVDVWIDYLNWDISLSIDKWFGVTVKDHRIVGLHIGDVGYGKIGPEIENLTELESFTFYGGIENLDSSISTLTNLEELNLAGNTMTELPFDISSLTQLRILDLHANKLKKIPSQLFDLPNLEIINLSNNNLTEIPSDIIKLTRLKELDVSHNKLITLPDELQHTEIEKIDIETNRLCGASCEVHHWLLGLNVRMNTLGCTMDSVEYADGVSCNIQPLDLHCLVAYAGYGDMDVTVTSSVWCKKYTDIENESIRVSLENNCEPYDVHYDDFENDTYVTQEYHLQVREECPMTNSVLLECDNTTGSEYKESILYYGIKEGMPEGGDSCSYNYEIVTESFE